MTIQSPPAWIVDRLNQAAHTVGTGEPDAVVPDSNAPPRIRVMHFRDLLDALALGWRDFAANRTDIIFLCALYPALGLVLGRAASGYGLLPLLFPLAAGFALVGPLAAVGINELSRRRERGEVVHWSGVFGVVRSPSIGAIAVMAALLVGIFVVWIAVANLIYALTLGPALPESVAGFVREVFTTRPGWALIGVGGAVGFAFAAVVLTISVVTFPMLLDRRVSVSTAMLTSVRVVARNPAVMAGWGLIVAAGLILGSLPFFLGLVVVLPVLGHATWHLYRKAVRWPRSEAG